MAGAAWRGTLVAAALLVSDLPCHATSASLDPTLALAQSQQVIGRRLGDHTLLDASGRKLAMAEFRGRPLVISLVYTSCSSVCPPATQHMIGAVAEAGRVFGYDRFSVLTIGFDARNDTPVRLAQFAAVQGITAPNWRLASADGATLDALLRDLGFSYRAIAGGFDHIARTTIVDGEGRIYRHVYGEDFPLAMFMEPMKDVVFGTRTALSMSGVIDRIRFICSTYDPGAGRYRFDFGLLFGATLAGAALLAIGGLIMREWRRAPRRADAGTGMGRRTT